MKKNRVLLILSYVMYVVIILLTTIFIIVPGIDKIKEANSIKDLTYKEKTKLIDEINQKYIDLEKEVNEKYDPSISNVNIKYDDLINEVKDKYKALEKELNDDINNNKIAKNDEFFANGFSKKYYELSDKISQLQDEKFSLNSKEKSEIYDIQKFKNGEVDTINSNKKTEINNLELNKEAELNSLDNRTKNKTIIKIKGISKIVLGILIIIIPILYVVSMFNKLTYLSNLVKEKWSQIDVLLKQRADLIPNIVKAIKGYAKHEKSTFSEVTKARNKVIAASTKEEEIQTNKNLSNQIAKLLFLQENYPELKANSNFIKLQDDLRKIEDGIALYRQQYNSTVLRYKNKLEMFPSNIVADMFSFKQELFFEIDDEETENPNISL